MRDLSAYFIKSRHARGTLAYAANRVNTAARAVLATGSHELLAGMLWVARKITTRGTR